MQADESFYRNKEEQNFQKQGSCARWGVRLYGVPMVRTDSLWDKERVDFSAIAKAVTSRDPQIQFGMVDESGSVRFGSIGGDVLIVSAPERDGSPRSLVGISAQRVNDDFTWLRFVGDLGGVSFESLLLPQYVPCTFGFTCQQFQEVGQFFTSTPIKYCTPEFAAYLACTLLEDVTSYLRGTPFVRKATRIWNHIESTHPKQEEIEQIRTWIEETGESTVLLETTESALLISIRLSALSLVTQLIPDEDADWAEVEVISDDVLELSENMPFQDAGLALTVDPRDFMLALQIALPLDVANVEIVAEHLEFMEQAAQVVSGQG